jgi:hypothetical protein
MPVKRKFNAKLGREFFGLTESELTIFKSLSTPIKIQDFLDTLPVNWEKKGQTNMSPRSVLREKKAHCFEGAMLATLALWLYGEEPIILDLRVEKDPGHCLALYRRNGLWGAISKTNHAALRFRDPVYATIRELVLSYFHECWNDDTGKKNLRGFAGPFNMKAYKSAHHIQRPQKWGTGWVTDDADCNLLEDDMRYVSTVRLFPNANIRYLRKPDKMEMITGTMTEWKIGDPRT